jgi:hypothetical protein
LALPFFFTLFLLPETKLATNWQHTSTAEPNGFVNIPPDGFLFCYSRKFALRRTGKVPAPTASRESCNLVFRESGGAAFNHVYQPDEGDAAIGTSADVFPFG